MPGFDRKLRIAQGLAISRAAFRFAPSPNGRLHLGHAYSAVFNARETERIGGRLLVRIEDIDTIRCTRALGEAALADLAWLGLDWERPVRWQSERMAEYRATLSASGLWRAPALIRRFAPPSPHCLGKGAIV